MKNDLRVGMYARTKLEIGKIDDTRNFMNKHLEVHLDTNKGCIHNVADNTYWNNAEDIIKASDKLIDLIEVGDIVKFKELRTHVTNPSNTKYYEDYIYDVHNEEELSAIKQEIKQGHIKLSEIVTKECFEQISYKVGEIK